MTNMPAGMPLPSLLPKAAGSGHGAWRSLGLGSVGLAVHSRSSLLQPPCLGQHRYGGGQTEHCRGGHSGNCKTQSGLKAESVLERQVFSSRQSGNPTQTHGAFQGVFLSAAPWPVPVRSPRAVPAQWV